MALAAANSPDRAVWRKQDWAYEQVRERIITNQLKPGEPIDQEKLAAELGISRIPLRQGLGRLIAEGLMRDNPHRQWVVTELTKGDVRDIYLGREVLEALLAAEATPQISDSELDAMRIQLDLQAELLSANDVLGFRAADRGFHEILCQAARMPKTHATLTRLFTMSDRYIHLYQSDPERVSASLREHHQIYEALVRRDEHEVVRLIREHVVRGRAHLESLGGDEVRSDRP